MRHREHLMSSNNRSDDAQPDHDDLSFQSAVAAVEEHAIILLDADGAVASWNDGAERIHGYRSVDIIGEHISVFAPEDLLECDVPGNALEEAVTTGQYTDEHWCLREDGSEFWARVTITPIEEQNGTLVGFVMVTTDLTDRKDRERELEQYETIIESINDGVAVFDADMSITAVNDAFVDMLGYSRDELIGSHLSAFVDATVIERAEENRQALLDGARDGSELVVEVETAAGETRIVEFRGALLPFEDEFRGTAGIVRDVTDQKEYERRLEDLHTATRALLEADTSEEIATTAVEAADEILDLPRPAIHLVDDDGGLAPVAWTAEIEEILGGAPPTFEPGQGLAWETFETGEAAYWPDLRDVDDLYNPATQLRSELQIPLGEHGVLLVASTTSDAFDETQHELANILAAKTEAALDRVDRERDLAVFRSLLDQSSDSVFVIDPETTRFLDVNEAACRQLGYDRNELLALSVSDIQCAVDGIAETREVVEKVRDHGMVVFEGEHRRKDGSTFPVEITIDHIELDQEYVLSVARDITERKDLHLKGQARQQFQPILIR